MDNGARTDSSPILLEDWVSHGYAHDFRDEQVGHQLVNDIHSMFSYELDHIPQRAKTKARWGKLTREEYELLDQPLRLATQWLESAASSDAICSLVYGYRYTPPENPTFDGAPVSEFYQHGMPSAIARRAAGDVLDRLGDTIRFQATDRDDSPGMRQGVHGSTWPSAHFYPEGIAITDRPEKTGLACITRLHPEYLNILKELLKKPLENDFQILKHYFEIAITICHEVMHAIDYARETNLLKTYLEMGDNVRLVAFNEPFYEDQRVAEIGYFWENHVFGGAFNQSMPEPADALFLGQWPSLLFRDKENQPERAPPTKVCFRWLVSADYIKNSLTQEFWDEVTIHHPHDLVALRIRRSIAHKVELEQDYEDYDKTWDHTDPANVPPSCGHPDRVPWHEIDPSVCARRANESFDERQERLDLEWWRAGF